ncbi:MAG TPA: two-component regulator propeller domain-containing protein, partial [Thermoanaerobaculia bacterium]
PLDAYGPGARVRFTRTGLVQSRMRRNCIAVAPDGWVWVGTRDGIVRYSFGEKLETQKIDTGAVMALMVRRDGSVLASLDDGTILRVTGNTVRVLTRTTPVTGALAELADGTILGGRGDGAVWRLENDEPRVINHDLRERVVTLLVTRGELWAASLGTGAVRIDLRDPSQRLAVTRANGLLGETLWTMFEDREGNLWFGQNGGVSRLRKGYRAFSAWTARTRPALPDPNTFAVLPRDGALWVGTGNGLTRLGTDAKTWRVSDGLHSNQIYTLAEDADGRLWIGTSAGVNSMSGERIEKHGFDTTYAIRRRGRMTCFAGVHGIACHEDGKWSRYARESGLSPGGASSLAFDDDGRLWVGSPDRGLYRSSGPLAPGVTFARVWGTVNGAPSDSVRSLLFHGGNLWVGTGAGLSIPGKAHVYRGRPAIGMTPSADGTRVWVSNNAGLVEIDASTLRVLSTVSKADGLVDDEAWAYGPIGADAEGRIYFATPRGVSLFRPAARERNETPPIVRLRRIDGAGEDNDVGFEYAALTFGDESRVRFRTRLAGFDRAWSEETRDAKIRYTNLPAMLFARSYAFEVRARNADGVWSEPLSYEFRVAPPLWLRWWAALAYLAVLALALTAFNRWRTRQLHRKNRVLEDLVMARTEEIRAQASELETLDRIVESINREVSLENVLRSVLEQGMKLFPKAQKGAFLMFDHETRRTDVVGVAGYDPELFRGVSLSFEEAMQRYS